MTRLPRLALRHFEARFAALGSPTAAASQKAYMKSALAFHGVDAATMVAEARAFLAGHPDLDHDALVAIADALFGSRWFDLRSVAVILLEKRRRLLGPADADFLVDLARRGACWAHVDAVVTKVLGPVLERDPALPRRVRAWARDADFWVRRVALLAQLGTLRRGGGDFELFASVAAPMLPETEFFVRKAIGWVLREVSKDRPALVRDFLLRHPAAAGLTFREATKYLPPAMLREVSAARVTSGKPSSRRARSRAATPRAPSRGTRRT